MSMSPVAAEASAASFSRAVHRGRQKTILAPAVARSLAAVQGLGFRV